MQYQNKQRSDINHEIKVEYVIQIHHMTIKTFTKVTGFTFSPTIVRQLNIRHLAETRKLQNMCVTQYPTIFWEREMEALAEPQL